MTMAAIGGGLLGAFSQQSRSVTAMERHQDNSTAGVALARDAKTAKEARKNAANERMLALLTDPQVMGLLTVFGGIYAANNIPWSGDPGTRARIAGVAAASAVLMGLGRAGVGDMTTLAVAAAAGLASGGGAATLSGELVPGSGVPWYLTGSPMAGFLVAKNRIWGE